MSDKEAYELLVKYSGGEQGLLKTKELVHALGIDGAVSMMADVYKNAGKPLPLDFKEWMRQAFTYMSSLSTVVN